jgi:hypothetical protein
LRATILPQGRAAFQDEGQDLLDIVGRLSKHASDRPVPFVKLVSVTLLGVCTFLFARRAAPPFERFAPPRQLRSPIANCRPGDHEVPFEVADLGDLAILDDKAGEQDARIVATRAGRVQRVAEAIPMDLAERPAEDLCRAADGVRRCLVRLGTGRRQRRDADLFRQTAPRADLLPIQLYDQPIAQHTQRRGHGAKYPVVENHLFSEVARDDVSDRGDLAVATHPEPP